MTFLEKSSLPGAQKRLAGWLWFYGPAAASGLLLAGAFPNLGLAGLAWVAPGLMLVPAFGRGLGERFRLGYAAGLVYHLATLYWLLLIPYRWHGIPFGPMLGWLALSAYLALYQAVWVCLLTQPRRRGLFQSREPGSQSPLNQLVRPEAFLAAAGSTWISRTLWALWGAAAWVSLEFLLAWFLSGFPWGLLGVSQYRLVPLLQVASVTGVYGMSFLVVWASLSLLSAGYLLLRSLPGRRAWAAEIFVPFVTIAVLFHSGLRHLERQHRPVPAGRSLAITMVQPSIPQTLIWDPAGDTVRIADLIRLSEAALTNRTDVLIWPEAAVPKLLRYDKEVFEAVTGLARKHGIWMIIGADDAEPLEKPLKNRQANFYNSSFLIDPKGRLVDRYQKRSLVIFGEYIPLERWLPFLSFFTPIQGGFTPGDRPVQFQIPDHQVSASVLICFEDIFPSLGREAARADTDLLVNLTNNGWFGESAAQWQHAVTAIFRAVENQVPLIRCSNNGLTCWVDETGRLREVFRDVKGSVYGPGFLRVELPLGPADQPRVPTFYNRHGDWFAWVCVGIALGLAVTRAAAFRSVFAGKAETNPSDDAPSSGTE